MSVASLSRPGLFDRLLRLSLLRLGLLALAWLGSVVAHNMVYGLLHARFPAGWDEPVFFTLATIVIPAYVLAAGLYTLLAVVLRWPRA